jgi:hypothetical protein
MSVSKDDLVNFEKYYPNADPELLTELIGSYVSGNVIKYKEIIVQDSVNKIDVLLVNKNGTVNIDGDVNVDGNLIADTMEVKSLLSVDGHTSLQGVNINGHVNSVTKFTATGIVELENLNVTGPSELHSVSATDITTETLTVEELTVNGPSKLNSLSTSASIQAGGDVVAGKQVRANTLVVKTSIQANSINTTMSAIIGNRLQVQNGASAATLTARDNSLTLGQITLYTNKILGELVANINFTDCNVVQANPSGDLQTGDKVYISGTVPNVLGEPSYIVIIWEVLDVLNNKLLCKSNLQMILEDSPTTKSILIASGLQQVSVSVEQGKITGWQVFPSDLVICGGSGVGYTGSGGGYTGIMGTLSFLASSTNMLPFVINAISLNNY